MRRSARFYQAVCLLLAVAVLVGVVAPVHSRLLATRSRLIPESQRAGDLGELDSFSMALLLGGFRGPLVMYLWMTSEDEKSRDESEKLLTRAEMIGNLQPQFSTIYIHQSWNLAYNVSVQYNRPSEKYRWVIAGIEFAEKGERRLPNDVNVISQLGDLYFDKLGQSYESDYYLSRFRHDSLDALLTPVETDGRARLMLKDQYAARWQYIDRLDGLLAEIRRIAQTTGRAAMPDAPVVPDGVQARHAWPYGVSAFAIAFDYYQQATHLGPHAQFGESVISSRPAIAARAWVDEEVELALASEAMLWPINQLAVALPAPTASLLRAEEMAKALDKAIFHYREAQRVAELAEAAYLSHLQRYPNQGDTFVTHLNHVALKRAMAEAGELRLAGIAELLRAQPTDAPAVQQARQKLADARIRYANAIQLIRDFIATEYRRDPWGENTQARAPYDRMIDQAQRAVDQIDALLARQ